MSEETSPQSLVIALARGRGGGVLLRAADGAPPHARVDAYPWPADVAGMESGLRDALGFAPTLLRCDARVAVPAADATDGDAPSVAEVAPAGTLRLTVLVYVARWDGPQPAGYVWRPEEALSSWIPSLPRTASSAAVSDAVVGDGLQEAIRRARSIAAAPDPPARPPWQREDGGAWDAQARAWIEDALRARGRAPDGPPRAVKRWPLSCVWRVPSAGRDAYFKAALRLPLFTDEARFTRGLAERLPDHAPRVLAADDERNWLLLEDFGPALGAGEDPDDYRTAAAFVARFQRRAAALLPAWRAAGALDRALPGLAARLPALAEDAIVAREVGPERLAAFREALPALRDALLELDAGPLPTTLVHGDLHPGNLARRGDDFLLFDWTDACLGHPMIDTLFLRSERAPVSSDAMRDAYLDVWREGVDDAALTRAWALGGVAYGLHQLESYASIQARLEPEQRRDMAGATEAFLGRALDALATMERG